MYRRFILALVVAFLVFAGLVGGRGVSPVAAAIEVEISASDDELECGRSITVTAKVTDNGTDVADGTDVTFRVGNQIIAVVETEDGEASITVQAPAGFAGPLVITASVGSVSDSITINVTCITAGPPATVQLVVTPATITCGSQASVLATVRDAAGRLVGGATVDFVATGSGSIIPTAPTINGLATSVFTATPGSSGAVQVTARVRGTALVATASLQVTCAVAPTATQRPPATVVPPTAVPSTGIRPPSTGDAGLAQ